VEYTRLGNTDLEVSRVGFGCWAIGGHGWGKVDDHVSIKAIHRALDLGINFFDTADVYGFGHSEEVLCRALGELRTKVIIATKFGVTWDAEKSIGHDTSPGRIIKALEGSLRRLRLDCIPLWQIHWPDQKTPLSATMEALIRCQEEGKVRHLGCSNFSAEQICEAQEYGRLESLQASYNILDRSIEGSLLECCQRFQMGIVAYNPLAQGLLSGKFGVDVKFGGDDIRSRSKYFCDGQIKDNLRATAQLREVAKQFGKSPAQVAIRWVLDKPGVACAIPGMKTPRQVEENVGAMDWRLPLEEWENLSSFREAREEGEASPLPDGDGAHLRA
jgi:aryl-alcohol dehydrogenase-like predicted oxidoreductase